MPPSAEDNNLDILFDRLARSPFRSRFKLSKKERQYLKQKGFSVIEQHARNFIRERLGSAFPKSDGQQTPMRNHPVFVAQHATATCCRKCLEKWHGIKPGVALTDEQVDYITQVLMRWLREIDISA